TINLSSGSADIGSSGLPMLTAASSHLSLNTAGTGSVYANQTGAFTLDNSGAGGSFTLNASAAASISNVHTINGNLQITNGGGVLQVLGAAQITASGGNITLQNNDTVGGSIALAAYSSIIAGGAATGQGQVNIVIGPVPGTPVVGVAPKNITKSI